MGRATIDRERVRKLHSKGKSIIEIATRLDCSTSGVKWAAKALGLTFKAPPDPVPEAALRTAIDEGLNRQDAALKFGVSVNTINARSKKYGVKFPAVVRMFEATRSELEAQVALGFSGREIAKHFGFSEPVVRARLREFNLQCKKLHRKKRGFKSGLSREIAETFTEQGMSPEEIAEKVGFDLDYVRKRLRDFGLIDLIRPARAIGAFKSAPTLPKMINSVERVNTPAEQMAEKIFKHEMRVLCRGYSDATRGLNPSGDVVIRARAKCGARAVFVVGESVPRACGKSCSCKGRQKWRITKK